MVEGKPQHLERTAMEVIQGYHMYTRTNDLGQKSDVYDIRNKTERRVACRLSLRAGI